MIVYQSAKKFHRTCMYSPSVDFKLLCWLGTGVSEFAVSVGARVRGVGGQSL